MRSPFADCDAILKCENADLEFRKEKFSYTYLFYECPQTKETFTTDEIDTVSIMQIYNQYRVKYGIPFPDEIRAARQKYGLSAAKMSQILGFGDNQYRLYENGEMPSEANGKILMTIMNRAVFKSVVENSKHQFDKDEYAKIIAKINVLADEDDEKKVIKNIVFNSERGLYNGFAERSLNKLKNVLLFFIDKCGGVFKTKINKLLFYTDFYAYKTYGFAITGLSYKAIKFGPVPKNWNRVYSMFDEIEEVPVDFGGDVEGSKLVSEMQPDFAAFKDNEIKVLEYVYSQLGNATSAQISEISHQEDAWKENVGAAALIDFSYAFSLKAI